MVKGRGAASRLFEILGCAAVLFGWVVACRGADIITGEVRNATKAQPAAGDEVILLGLDENRHEESRTKVNSQGMFTIDLKDPGRPHLLRVMHQGVSYDKTVSSGGRVTIDVFDSTARAPGIAGRIEIIRAGTSEEMLHVSDMIEITNRSDPLVTQAGARTFEVYLPSDAIIKSILAAGPGDGAESISAEPAGREPGHYAVNFPLRPGATKFAFNYDLPYKGRAKFRAKSDYPFQQLAVMIPPAMRFTARASAFHTLPVGGDRYHVVSAENVKAGTELAFEISGTGAMPATGAKSQSASNRRVEAAGPAPAIAFGTLAGPDAAAIAGQGKKPARRSSIVRWWAFAALLGFAACMFLVWRQHRPGRLAPTSIPSESIAQRPVYLVGALKEDLLQLESDRLQGLIRGEDYTLAKHALELTIDRALTRIRNGKANAAAR